MAIIQPSEPRPAPVIIADIENLVQTNGFIYCFAYMVLSSLWTRTDQLADIDWNARPNPAELTLVLGLMVKQPLHFSPIPTEQVARQQAVTTYALLEELHQAHIYQPHHHDTDHHPNHQTTDAEPQSFGNWMNTGQRMVESIFYGGAGAYDFQYLEMAPKRYKYDQPWLAKHLNTNLDVIVTIAHHLKHLAQTRVSQITAAKSFVQFALQLLNALSFTLDDLRHIDTKAVDAFLTFFTLTPGTVNQDFNSIGSYNAAHSHPIIDIGDNRLFLPIFNNLAESIYESPYYWMLEDAAYKNLALDHRGTTTEEIASELLGKVFGYDKVYRGLKISTGPHDITDIDAFAWAGNTAVILQAKSKKLTVASRQGKKDNLTSDFQKAIQESFIQGLTARTSLLNSRGFPQLDTRDSDELCEGVDEAYILCITGDHYPAIAVQSRAYLHKDAADPYPIAMSIFDLDIVTFYLTEPEELLYYLRQRSIYADHFISDSEMALLGFHLSNKLFPSEQTDSELINSSFAQLVDANYPVARGHWPKTDSAERLFHRWKNEWFDELIHAIKASGHARVIDILFLLYDLAGDAADNITNTIEAIQAKTRLDGQIHDVSFPISRHNTGVTFVSLGPPLTTSRRQDLERQFNLVALARKHKSRADEWLGLASVPGSARAFDMIWYSKEPWQPDSELDELVGLMLKPGTFVKADGLKVGRNDPCPCGSGLKFKRCHDKLRFN